MSAPVPSVVPPPTAPPAAVLDWGRTRYEPARLAQEALVARHLAGEIGDTLVFTEHDPVFTVGLRAGAEQHLVWDAARLTAEEIAWAPAQTLADVAVDPQVHAAGGIVDMPGKDGVGTFKSPGGPARFHGVDDGPKGPGPKLGEHTREILKSIGYSDVDVEAMYAGKSVA